MFKGNDGPLKTINFQLLSSIFYKMPLVCLLATLDNDGIKFVEICEIGSCTNKSFNGMLSKANINQEYIYDNFFQNKFYM